MLNNSLWNLVIKAASFLAVLLLLLGAALTYAAHFGLTQNNTAVVLADRFGFRRCRAFRFRVNRR